MSFKLRSQGPGDGEPIAVTVGASGSSEEKSVGMDVAANRGALSANAATSLSKLNQSFSGGLGYNKGGLSASINAEKSLGQKANLSGRVTYKF